MRTSVHKCFIQSTTFLLSDASMSYMFISNCNFCCHYFWITVFVEYYTTLIDFINTN